MTPLRGLVADPRQILRIQGLAARRQPRMFVVQPDAVLPAGRYALVLNGYGYDFTVAGPITAPEQCLEQTQVVNGVVVDGMSGLNVRLSRVAASNSDRRRPAASPMPASSRSGG